MKTQSSISISGRSKPRFSLILPLLIALLLGGLLSVLGFVYFKDKIDHAESDRKIEALEHLSFIRSQLESYLNNDLYRVKGLTVLPSLEMDKNNALFEKLAEELAGNDEHILSLQLAKNGVVSHVWPYERNKAALGHNLLADPRRRAAAKKAIDKRRLWVAGPVKLRQGGVALIGRYPIFRTVEDGNIVDEYFWGFATVLIDWRSLINDAFGSAKRSPDFDIALRGKDGMGKAGGLILGQPEVFQSRPVLLEITLPGGSWEIAAAPRTGWRVEPAQLLMKTIYLAIVALLMVGAFLAARVFMQTRFNLKAERARLALAEKRFSDDVEAIPVEFAVFDSQERLAVSNDRFRSSFGIQERITARGAKARDIFKRAIESGLYSRENTKPSTFEVMTLLAERYDRFTSAAPSFDDVLCDGRVMRTIQQRTPSGGVAIVIQDVTDLHVELCEQAETKTQGEAEQRTLTGLFAQIFRDVESVLEPAMGLPNGSFSNPVSYDHICDIRKLSRDGAFLAGLELGQERAQPNVFSLHNVLNESTHLLRDTGSTRLRVDYTRTQTVPELTYGDQAMFRNLIGYAIQSVAMLSRNDKVQVQVDAEDESDGFILKVKVAVDSAMSLDNKVRKLLSSNKAYTDTSLLYGTLGTKLALFKLCGQRCFTHVSVIEKEERVFGFDMEIRLPHALPIEQAYFRYQDELSLCG